MRRVWIALWWLVWVSISLTLAQLYRWVEQDSAAAAVDFQGVTQEALGTGAPAAWLQ